MLEGIRVVELGVWVAGPAAAGIMADWGADVIKVEAPSGDPMRRMLAVTGGGRGDLPSPPFDLDNRGKRSVVFDLETDEGRESMQRLLATADVFMTNLRPEAVDRLGLGPDQVRAAASEADLCDGHRVRPRRAGDVAGRLRRRRVLGAVGSGRARRPARRSAAAVPRRRRRPRHRDHDAGRHPRRAVAARAHGRGSGRRDVAAAHRHLLPRLGPRHPTAARQARRRRCRAPSSRIR